MKVFTVTGQCPKCGTRVQIGPYEEGEEIPVKDTCIIPGCEAEFTLAASLVQEDES